VRHALDIAVRISFAPDRAGRARKGGPQSAVPNCTPWHTMTTLTTQTGFAVVNTEPVTVPSMVTASPVVFFRRLYYHLRNWQCS
jgi:hypothetical protein